MQKRWKTRAAVVVALLGVIASSCDIVADENADEQANQETEAQLSVAAGPDPETALLAHTVVELLAHADLSGEVVNFSDARDTRQALQLGAVDVSIAYTGEAWLESLGQADPPGDPAESFRAVRNHDREHDIIWLRPRLLDGVENPPANATFAFVVAGPPGLHADLSTVSQLATRLSEQPDAPICVDEQFASRSDGLRAVLAAYSVRSGQPVFATDPVEAVGAVATGICVAGLTTATDGEVWRQGLRPLDDDLEVFPAFVPLPQVRLDAADQYPSLRGAISPLPAQLTTKLLGQANARVANGDPLEEVAADLAVELRARAGRTS